MLGYTRKASTSRATFSRVAPKIQRENSLEYVNEKSPSQRQTSRSILRRFRPSIDIGAWARGVEVDKSSSKGHPQEQDLSCEITTGSLFNKIEDNDSSLEGGRSAPMRLTRKLVRQCFRTQKPYITHSRRFEDLGGGICISHQPRMRPSEDMCPIDLSLPLPKPELRYCIHDQTRNQEQEDTQDVNTDVDTDSDADVDARSDISIFSSKAAIGASTPVPTAPNSPVRQVVALPLVTEGLPARVDTPSPCIKEVTAKNQPALSAVVGAETAEMVDRSERPVTESVLNDNGAIAEQGMSQTQQLEEPAIVKPAHPKFSWSAKPWANGDSPAPKYPVSQIRRHRQRAGAPYFVSPNLRTAAPAITPTLWSTHRVLRVLEGRARRQEAARGVPLLKRIRKTHRKDVMNEGKALALHGVPPRVLHWILQAKTEALVAMDLGANECQEIRMVEHATATAIQEPLASVGPGFGAIFEQVYIELKTQSRPGEVPITVEHARIPQMNASAMQVPKVLPTVPSSDPASFKQPATKLKLECISTPPTGHHAQAHATDDARTQEVDSAFYSFLAALPRTVPSTHPLAVYLPSHRVIKVQEARRTIPAPYWQVTPSERAKYEFIEPRTVAPTRVHQVYTYTEIHPAFLHEVVEASRVDEQGRLPPASDVARQQLTGAGDTHAVQRVAREPRAAEEVYEADEDQGSLDSLFDEEIEIEAVLGLTRDTVVSEEYDTAADKGDGGKDDDDSPYCVADSRFTQGLVLSLSIVLLGTAVVHGAFSSLRGWRAAPG